MNPSIDDMIEETALLINNHYNLSQFHYDNVTVMVNDIFNNILSKDKICRFLGKLGSGTNYYYHISMPYIISVLAKYTNKHVVMVFESIYILEVFKKDLLPIFKMLGIDINKQRFKLTTTTVHRIRYVCIGNIIDAIIGWMPTGNLFYVELKNVICYYSRSASTLILLPINYLTTDEFENKMNLILSNGFKIRM